MRVQIIACIACSSSSQDGIKQQRAPRSMLNNSEETNIENLESKWAQPPKKKVWMPNFYVVHAGPLIDHLDRFIPKYIRPPCRVTYTC